MHHAPCTMHYHTPYTSHTHNIMPYTIIHHTYAPPYATHHHTPYIIIYHTAHVETREETWLVVIREETWLVW
jgi:hypothetical protein